MNARVFAIPSINDSQGDFVYNTTTDIEVLNSYSLKVHQAGFNKNYVAVYTSIKAPSSSYEGKEYDILLITLVNPSSSTVSDFFIVDTCPASANRGPTSSKRFCKHIATLERMIYEADRSLVDSISKSYGSPVKFSLKPSFFLANGDIINADFTSATAVEKDVVLPVLKVAKDLVPEQDIDLNDTSVNNVAKNYSGKDWDSFFDTLWNTILQDMPTNTKVILSSLKLNNTTALDLFKEITAGHFFYPFAESMSFVKDFLLFYLNNNNNYVGFSQKPFPVLGGPPGTGKSFLANILAEVASKHLDSVAKVITVGRTDSLQKSFDALLIGKDYVESGTVFFKPGYLLEAVREAYLNHKKNVVIVINEFNANPNLGSLDEVIRQITDNRRVIVSATGIIPQDYFDILQKSSNESKDGVANYVLDFDNLGINVLFLGTANFGVEYNVSALPPPLLRRSKIYMLNYPSANKDILNFVYCDFMRYYKSIGIDFEEAHSKSSLIAHAVSLTYPVVASKVLEYINNTSIQMFYPSVKDYSDAVFTVLTELFLLRENGVSNALQVMFEGEESEVFNTFRRMFDGLITRRNHDVQVFSDEFDIVKSLASYATKALNHFFEKYKGEEELT